MGNTASGSTATLAMVGSSRSGKSCLVRALRQQPATHIGMDCYFATVAPDVTSMPVPTAAGEFDTQVWDTSGLFDFTALAMPYLRGADAILFVFDLTDPDSFAALSQWWDSLAKPLALEAKTVLLVGNKLDLNADRAVTHARVRLWCTQHGIDPTQYVETSAKTGHNVLLAFQRALQLVHERRARAAQAAAEEAQPQQKQRRSQRQARSVRVVAPPVEASGMAASAAAPSGNSAHESGRSGGSDESGAAETSGASTAVTKPDKGAGWFPFFGMCAGSRS